MYDFYTYIELLLNMLYTTYVAKVGILQQK